MNLPSIVKNYTNQQIEDLKKAQCISSEINVFHRIKLTSASVLDLTEFKVENVLYYFEIADNESISFEEVCSKITIEKKNSNIKFPKVNQENIQKGNKVLYVGKSSGYFSNRLKAHLGQGSKSTYALHLNEWERIFGKELKLVLNYVSLQDILTEQTLHLLEIIESSLHLEFKPLLGRTGH